MSLKLSIQLFFLFWFFSSCDDGGLLYSFGNFKYRYLYSMVEANYMGHIIFLKNFDPEKPNDLIEIQKFAYCYLNSVNEDKYPFGQIHLSSKNNSDSDLNSQEYIYCSLYFDDYKNIRYMSVNNQKYTYKNYPFLQRKDVYCPKILPCAKRNCPDTPSTNDK
jgi:hypothetical protein